MAIIIFVILIGTILYIHLVKIPRDIFERKLVFEFPDKYEQYKTIKCNPFDLIGPEYVFLGIRLDRDPEIFFYDASAKLYPTNERLEYTGGTTIKNTTFPELVKMVKEDCSQFQESYYDLTGYENYEELSYDEQTKLWPEIEKNNLNWIYSPAPTEEEIEEENKMSAESFISRLSNEIESQEAWELFVEIYGDPYKMTTEEILKLKEKINKEGQDERIYILDRVTTIHNSWPKLSEKNQQTILAAYGPWEELSDKELADYVERIYTDQEKGKLVLD